jgi:hypothetical protein
MRDLTNLPALALMGAGFELVLDLKWREGADDPVGQTDRANIATPSTLRIDDLERK